jgi:hypothetical protein
MMWSTVFLAAEDPPGLAIGRKLIAEHGQLSIYREVNGYGCGNLKRNTPSYDKMAKGGLPVLLLTDLDTAPCPTGKILTWLSHAPSRDFLFRICVREVEAWLLADCEAMGEFLKVRPTTLPREPEALPDPKAALIAFAQKAPRKIREGLTPRGGSSKGPEYNELLEQFIADSWSCIRAAERAPSLARARRRIGELAARVAAAH